MVNFPVQIQAIIVLSILIISSVAGRFEHLHDDENDMDFDMEINQLHVDGNSHIFAKTCFPVTMEVCLPIGHNGTNPLPTPKPTTTTPSPNPCLNDQLECPMNYYCYGKTCLRSINDDSLPFEMSQLNCSDGCQPACPYGSCTLCTTPIRCLNL